MVVSDAHEFVSWLSHTSTYTPFLSKATDYFSHMPLQRGERQKYAGKKSRLKRVMSPTRSPLSHPGWAPEERKLWKTLKEKEKMPVTMREKEKEMMIRLSKWLCVCVPLKVGVVW